MSKNKNYTPLSEPIPITEQEWPKGTIPLVHTRTMTFMHENYIRDCIDGILMQKTTFPVQVLIHDDASTDGTADIVREYAEKYPKLIKAYFQKENSYSQKDKSMKLQMRQTFWSWRIGKYEALCEGDDYWTDPYKLQKQVDFLEANEEYSMCFHNVNQIDQDDKLLKLGNYSKMEYFDSKEIILHPHIPTLSLLFRNFSDKYNENFKDAPHGDKVLFTYLATKGKACNMGFVAASYRHHIGGIYSSLSNYNKYKNILKTRKLMLKSSYFDNKIKGYIKLDYNRRKRKYLRKLLSNYEIINYIKLFKY